MKGLEREGWAGRFCMSRSTYTHRRRFSLEAQSAWTRYKDLDV